MTRRSEMPQNRRILSGGYPGYQNACGHPSRVALCVLGAIRASVDASGVGAGCGHHGGNGSRVTGLPLYILAGIAAIAALALIVGAVGRHSAQRAALRGLRDFQDQYDQPPQPATPDQQPAREETT